MKERIYVCHTYYHVYVTFLKEFGAVEPEEGYFTDCSGKVLGRHKGLVCYTKGQRRGLGVSADRPLYVVAKDAAQNRIILGDNADLFSSSLVAGTFNWVSIPCPAGEIAVTAKTRYTQQVAQAVARPLPDGRVQVLFSQPQRAVTPGQSVVLYHEDLVLGGGVIEETE
jgi:tRNA-specific 2-thiouridylase